MNGMSRYLIEQEDNDESETLLILLLISTQNTISRNPAVPNVRFCLDTYDDEQVKRRFRFTRGDLFVLLEKLQLAYPSIGVSESSL